jgi:hypothetical protein
MPASMVSWTVDISICSSSDSFAESLGRSDLGASLNEIHCIPMMAEVKLAALVERTLTPPMDGAEAGITNDESH